MNGELLLVIRWWSTFFLVGAVAYPLTRELFPSWFDRGYAFAKSIGLVTVSFLVFLLASIGIVPFGLFSIGISLGIVFGLGIGSSFFHTRDMDNREKKGEKGIWLTLIVEELLFFGALLFWAWVKGHEADIHGLEKFMDFGFAKSILGSAFFPPPDMWYSGEPINYYYFGHFVMALLTKLSGLDLRYTFNLMLAALFAFTFTMPFSIGVQLVLGNRGNKEGMGMRLTGIGAGFLTAFLVSLAGNMQTIYAFTQGYTGEDVKPFWELIWPLQEFFKRLPEGMNTYWYANATRFIPFSIHEFPGYSFVVSDVHGHVLSLPFVLLAIALLFAIFGEKQKGDPDKRGDWVRYVFFGVLLGVLFMTNVLDAPIYGGLFIILFMFHTSFFISHPVSWLEHHGMKLVCVIGAAGASIVPFIVRFKSFVSGIAVNCPPAFLANRRFGPILFESVEKCQHSPLWMMWLLWGFFIFCGTWFIIFTIKNSLRLRSGHAYRKSNILGYVSSFFTQQEVVLIVFFLYSIGLIIFPEFFYFKDIYPAHFRSNTMFKLGYQAFILFTIVSGYAIIQMISEVRHRILNHELRIMHMLPIVILVPQLFLVSIYPYFSVRSYFGHLGNYKTLDGLQWFERQYPDDYKGVMWMNAVTHTATYKSRDTFPVIVEADGDSYTDYARYSAFTGFPTIIGWSVHEWLWRGTYDVVAPRREDVRKIYEDTNAGLVTQILRMYHVRYIVVGGLERQKYTHLRENLFQELGTVVFETGDTRIYEISAL